MSDGKAITSTTKRGAIATPHFLATKAGEDAFRAGGNAIDAALAAAAVLNVVYPNNTAIGGDLVALIRTPGGAVHCINATGYAPAAQSSARLRSIYGRQLPLRGVDTITVPGAIRGWESIRTFGAALAWESHFDAAVNLARHGAPVSRSVAAAIKAKSELLALDPGCRELFLPQGAPLSVGDSLVQPALAESLTELQQYGPDALYGGELGSRLVEGLARLGSVMTLDDLATYTPAIVEPISRQFRGHNVYTSPPNTQGFALLRALDRVERIGDPEDILGTSAGYLAEIFEQSNTIRNARLADPEFSQVDTARLISDDPDPSQTVPSPTRAGGDTVGIAAIDSSGFAVSLIQSVFNAFGSAVLETSTGILMQNRGTSFSLDEHSPNVVEPRKRPRHTLMPVLVSRAGKIRWVSATMGGQGQPQIHAQLLLRSLGGQNPSDAVAAPRWIVGVQEDGDARNTVYIESDVANEAQQSIMNHGFRKRLVPPHDEWLGHANLIKVGEDGDFEAASDLRSDGSAVVVEITES